MKSFVILIAAIVIIPQFLRANCEEKVIRVTSADAVNRLGPSMSGGISYYGKRDPKSPDGSVLQGNPDVYCIQYNGGDKVLSYLVHSYDYSFYCKVRYDIHIGNNSCE